MKTISYNSLSIIFHFLFVKKPRDSPAIPTFFASIKEKILTHLCYNLLFTCSLTNQWIVCYRNLLKQPHSLYQMILDQQIIIDLKDDSWIQITKMREYYQYF